MVDSLVEEIGSRVLVVAMGSLVDVIGSLEVEVLVLDSGALRMELIISSVEPLVVAALE